MYFLTAAVVLSLAVFAEALDNQQYRLVRTEVKCGDNQRCPRNQPDLISGCVGVVYGEKDHELKGQFCANYRPDGLVNFTTSAAGAGPNPLQFNRIRLRGSGPGAGGPRCQNPDVFDGNRVHRTIVAEVRHKFSSGAVDSNGAPVWFIRYRDVTVDFWLEPIQPEEKVIHPPIPIVDDELSVCLALGHKLEVFKSPSPYFWHIKVTPVDNYVSLTFGLGFKLTKCWVRPYLADGVTLGNNVVFLDEDHLDSAVLFNNPIVPNENTVRGEKYEFSFGQITDASLTNAMLHPDKLHKVYCNVCLCPLEGPADKRCPGQIPTRTLVHGVPNPLVERGSGGRSGIQARSFRPLYEEALLVGGHARQV